MDELVSADQGLRARGRPFGRCGGCVAFLTEVQPPEGNRLQTEPSHTELSGNCCTRLKPTVCGGEMSLIPYYGA